MFKNALKSLRRDTDFQDGSTCCSQGREKRNKQTEITSGKSTACLRDLTVRAKNFKFIFKLKVTTF